jgi:DNA processing protein
MSSSISSQKIYEVAVGLIPGIGNMLTKQLISYCGSAEEVLKKSKTSLKKIPNIGDALATQIINSNVLHEAEQELKRAEKMGVEILFYTDEKYPHRLKQIADAPTIIYCKGKADFNNQKVIAIVGTREATIYGKELTEKIVEELKPQNCLIVSGLAYGIDIYAHKAALKFGLPTVGVMASGIDIVYPAVHKSTAIEMQENGAIITENKIGTIPDAPRFPARNRIIAGMCDALIVVEAATKGGALITAEIANSYHKEVFAVPGRNNDKFSNGCNQLIAQNKAQIFIDTQQVLATLNWDKEIKKSKKSKLIPDLNEDEKIIYEKLQNVEAMELDELSWQTGLNVNRLSSLLLAMEFSGFIKVLPGKKFKWVQ